MNRSCEIPMVILTSLLFFFSSLKGADNYFPLEIGNTWNYKYADEPGLIDYQSDAVFDTTRINNVLYFEFGSDKEYPYLIRADSLGRIWQKRDYGVTIWFDFTLPDSGFYEYYPFLEEPPHFVVRVSRNLSIDTFAGEFHNCVDFFFMDSTMFDAVLRYTFAPDVGIIRKQYGSVKFLMSSALVNGRIISEIQQTAEISKKFSIISYPNPFNRAMQIQFVLPQTDSVELNMYDVGGRKVMNVFKGTLPPGIHYAKIEVETFPSGIYLISLESKSVRRICKCSLVK